MTLATRCTSCATAFRVVQDQLKVSEGWVRCGRCDTVFNALEGLFDLGRDAGAIRQGPGPAPAESSGAERPPTRSVAAAPAMDWEAENASGDDLGDDESPTSSLGELLADPIDAHLFGPRKRAESAPKPAAELGARDRVEFSDARFDSDLFSENASVPDAEATELAAADAGEPVDGAALRPEFVRRADRRARWEGKTARIALGAASAGAALALALQTGHHFRDTLAARWPALRAPLVAWCALARCTIEPPRRIDGVLVESTALTRTAGQDAFVLSVTLKSRSAMQVAMPSIDLSLTDGNGRLVARRALFPRDFRASNALAPGAEAGLQVMLDAGTSAVVGYTVEIFYP